MMTSAALSDARPLVVEDAFVPASDPAIRLFIRNKHRADMTSFRAERTLLFIRGATYPASTAFDLPFGGMSWMDHLAQHGYDAYLLDLRGYGRSGRPEEMAAPADRHPPVVRGVTALEDVTTAVAFIRQRRFARTAGAKRCDPGSARVLLRRSPVL